MRKIISIAVIISMLFSLSDFAYGQTQEVAGEQNQAVAQEQIQEVVGRVLVIEDGPTLTHGEMAYGAGVVAAQRFGA